MTWTEVKAVFDVAPADWSAIIELFAKHGCENTLEEDRPPSLSSALIDVEGSGQVLQALCDDLMEAGAAEVQTRSLVDEDWLESWKRFFHPRPIGKRFLVRPTWEEAADAGRLQIVLDPGQAFGTGDHPTTRMCLEILEDLPVEGKAVADVGCGSGILSIGAALLGAASVHAVDIDPLSVEVARANAKSNGVTIAATAGRGIAPISDVAPFDVVISNIISAVLIQLAPEVAAALRPGGYWAVSGVIPDNWPDVRAATEREGFELVRTLAEEGWTSAVFQAPQKLGLQ